MYKLIVITLPFIALGISYNVSGQVIRPVLQAPVVTLQPTLTVETYQPSAIQLQGSSYDLQPAEGWLQ